MFRVNLRIVKQVFPLIIFSVFSFCKLSAQSSIEINTKKNKTNVIIKNFPKNATVLIVDENLKLLSITSTDEDGSALVKINKAIKTTITARTIHGDYEASNKANQIQKPESNMAVHHPSTLDKT